MITVRYPTGHTVVYNDANYLVRGDVWAILYDSKTDQNMIASISAQSGASIEFVQPCNIKTDFNTLDDALSYVNSNLDTTESCDTWGKRFKFLKELKAMLHDFDARSGRWRL